MAADLVSIADRIVTVAVTAANTALSITSPASAYALGVKLAPSARVNVGVAFSNMATTRLATGLTSTNIEYRVLYSVRLSAVTSAAADTAERDVLKCVAQFIDDVHLDLSLGGRVRDCQIVNVGTSDPEYRLVGNQEYREIPLIVTVTVHGPFTVNP